jgi:RND family efflux transporter MFP subunit
MKSKIYTHLATLSVATLLAACSATTRGPEADKAKRLDSLKTAQADLADEIKKLEAEVAKEHPEAVTVKAKDVSVTEIAARSFDHYVQTQGKVEAEDNILVSPKSMGVVTAVYVKEGQYVSKGQTLAQQDNAVIERNISAMKSQLELATSVYDRQKNLWDQKIGTEVQFIQAKTTKEGLEKQLEGLEEQNRMTRIQAPISGTVDEVVAKIGENVAPGQPAFRVVNTSNLKLTAKVSEAYVTNIKQGNKVKVNIPELNQQIEAKVTFVGRTIDPLSRTFVVEVNLPSKAELRPNMTGVIRVVYHTQENAIAVPINVVQDINGEKVVYTAETSGDQTIARKKVVIVDGVFDGAAQVQGLKAGEKIITFGYQGLSDGEFIKI